MKNQIITNNLLSQINNLPTHHDFINRLHSIYETQSKDLTTVFGIDGITCKVYAYYDAEPLFQARIYFYHGVLPLYYIAMEQDKPVLTLLSIVDKRPQITTSIRQTLGKQYGLIATLLREADATFTPYASALKGLFDLKWCADWYRIFIDMLGYDFQVNRLGTIIAARPANLWTQQALHGLPKGKRIEFVNNVLTPTFNGLESSVVMQWLSEGLTAIPENF